MTHRAWEEPGGGEDMQGQGDKSGVLLFLKMAEESLVDSEGQVPFGGVGDPLRVKGRAYWCQMKLHLPQYGTNITMI